MSDSLMTARVHYLVTRSKRLARVGPAIPDGWDRVLEKAYPAVWRRPYLVSVPAGWIDVLFALSEHLAAAGAWVDDTKEKYGTLRLEIRSDDPDADVFEIEHAYDNLSSQVCQDCGEAGSLRVDRGWWATLCDKHVVTRDQR